MTDTHDRLLSDIHSAHRGCADALAPLVFEAEMVGTGYENKASIHYYCEKARIALDVLSEAWRAYRKFDHEENGGGPSCGEPSCIAHWIATGDIEEGHE